MHSKTTVENTSGTFQSQILLWADCCLTYLSAQQLRGTNARPRLCVPQNIPSCPPLPRKRKQQKAASNRQKDRLPYRETEPRLRFGGNLGMPDHHSLGTTRRCNLLAYSQGIAARCHSRCSTMHSTPWHQGGLNLRSRLGKAFLLPQPDEFEAHLSSTQQVGADRELRNSRAIMGLTVSQRKRVSTQR